MIDRGNVVSVGANDFANRARRFFPVGTVTEFDLEEFEDRRADATGLERSIILPGYQAIAGSPLESLSSENGVFRHRLEMASHSLWKNLDDLDEKLNEQSVMPQVAAGTMASIASIFTAGYLAWLIRGGQILSLIHI